MHQSHNLCPTKRVKVNGLCCVCCLSQSRIIDILANCTCVASKGGVEGGGGVCGVGVGGVS